MGICQTENEKMGILSEGHIRELLAHGGIVCTVLCSKSAKKRWTLMLRREDGRGLAALAVEFRLYLTGIRRGIKDFSKRKVKEKDFSKRFLCKDVGLWRIA